MTNLSCCLIEEDILQNLIVSFRTSFFQFQVQLFLFIKPHWQWTVGCVDGLSERAKILHMQREREMTACVLLSLARLLLRQLCHLRAPTTPLAPLFAPRPAEVGQAGRRTDVITPWVLTGRTPGHDWREKAGKPVNRLPECLCLRLRHRRTPETGLPAVTGQRNGHCRSQTGSRSPPPHTSLASLDASSEVQPRWSSTV